MDLVCVEQLNLNLLINQQCFIVVIARFAESRAVGYNLATLVKDSEFRWIKGENCIASWSKPTGYRTDFAMYVAQLC